MNERRQEKKFLDIVRSCCAQDISKMDIFDRLEKKNLSFVSQITSYFSIWIHEFQKKLRTHYKNDKKPIVVVTPNDEHAKLLGMDIHGYHALLKEGLDKSSQPVQKIIQLVSWEVSMGTPIAQYAPVRSQRASALYEVAHAPPDILICSISQWNSLLPSPSLLRAHSLLLKTRDTFDPTTLTDTLIAWNYYRVPYVTLEGEFALRGEVLDICISKDVHGQGGAKSVRITFDYEHIESIRYFDTTSQLTTEAVESLYIHPRTEFIWNEQTREQLASNLDEIFLEISEHAKKTTYAHLDTYGYDEMDYMYGFATSKGLTHIVDYYPEAPVVLYLNYETLQKMEEVYWNAYKRVFLDMGHIQCVPRASRIQDIVIEKHARVPIVPVYKTKGTRDSLVIGDSENRKFAGNIVYFSKYLESAHDEQSHVFLSCLDDAQVHKLRVLLQGAQPHYAEPPVREKDGDGGSERDVSVVASQEEVPCYVKTQFRTGFSLSARNIELFTDVDLLGKKAHLLSNEKTQFIESIQEIMPGDLVVHIAHGIGKFEDLQRLTVAGVEKDFVLVQYAHKEKLFVPIEQMNLLQKYIGQSSEKIVLDTIGGKAWERRTQQVAKKIEDMSQELLETHAKRSTIVGYSFVLGEEWEEAFVNAFSYEETKDQVTAWNEISKDLEQNKPMDRLLVGDVGFGKTELAFRAAFRVISAGKQVVFLAPTTILVEQHYASAVERFKKFPVNIAMLSRFVHVHTQKSVVADLKMGRVDLLIGTHRVVQQDVQFRDLGLLIVDEEHKFGVKDKERMKQYKEYIDCLSISATPIPRTLYQSIVSLRDMSVLATPPQKRKPIRTYVEKFNEKLIAKAICTELDRKGQVFYLHNRVSTLLEVKRFIEHLVPHATVTVANGQMSTKELEESMHRFINRGANVLVSTTIIENGIDIPNVNTIIIDRADNFGIAQLYQLRGRVGRSNITAYAYLLYHDEYTISEIALERLSTISDNSELGAGFQVAMRDLEVRGSGNLLGKEQSGSIYSVGYEYYIKKLNDTMNSLRGKPMSAPQPILDLSYTGFIPTFYIQDSITKMEVYKQIVSVDTLQEYELLVEHITDRFGPVPSEVQNLFWISQLRILCTLLYISTLKECARSFELHFSNFSKISVDTITTLIQQGKVQVSKSQSNIILVPFANKSHDTLEEKYRVLHDILLHIDTEDT